MFNLVTSHRRLLSCDFPARLFPHWKNLWIISFHVDRFVYIREKITSEIKSMDGFNRTMTCVSSSQTMTHTDTHTHRHTHTHTHTHTHRHTHTDIAGIVDRWWKRSLLMEFKTIKLSSFSSSERAALNVYDMDTQQDEKQNLSKGGGAPCELTAIHI